MARPERFELPTTWFEAKYSIQLSYGRIRVSAFSMGNIIAEGEYFYFKYFSDCSGIRLRLTVQATVEGWDCHHRNFEMLLVAVVLATVVLAHYPGAVVLDQTEDHVPYKWQQRLVPSLN